MSLEGEKNCRGDPRKIRDPPAKGRRLGRDWRSARATNEAQLANETALESKGHRPDNLPTNLAN